MVTLRDALVVGALVGLIGCPSGGPGGDDDDSVISGDAIVIQLLTDGYLVAPLYGAIGFDGEFTELDFNATSLTVPIPAGTTDYQFVTVCEGAWGPNVSWLLASIDDIPSPVAGCWAPWLAEGSVVSGSATGSFDVIEVAMDAGSDTFLAVQEDFELLVPPGSHDLVAFPTGRGFGSPNVIVAMAGVDATSDVSGLNLDFAAGVAPDERAITTEGAPYYVGTTGTTSTGTVYSTGNEIAYLAPASTGVTTERLTAVARYTGVDEIQTWELTGKDGALGMPASVAEAFPHWATWTEGELHEFEQTQEPIWQVHTTLTTPEFVETRVTVTVVGDAGDGVAIPADPRASQPGFPAAAASGAPGSVSAISLRERVEFEDEWHGLETAARILAFGLDETIRMGVREGEPPPESYAYSMLYGLAQ